jgi:LysM repeat protein
MKETNPGPNNAPESTAGGTKLSTIFLVVLGLHVFVIVGIVAYNLLKGDTRVETAAAKPDPAPPPAVEQAAEEPAAQPVVQTSAEAAPQASAPAAGETSMPSPDDPIWSLGQVVPRPLDEEKAAEPAAPAAVAQPPVPVPVAVTPRLPAAGAATHVVQPGDSLSKIARRYGTSVQSIQQANQLQGSLIRAGQSLVVPGAVSSAVTAARPAAVPMAVPVAAAVPAGAAGSRTHMVAKGETLWGIARQHGIKPQELARANGITDAAKLKIGTRLTIPGAGGRREMVQPQQAPQPQATVMESTDMAMRP